MSEGGAPIHLTEDDLHPHLRARMAQRGVTLAEIQRALNDGRSATDTKPGTMGKVLVFSYDADWEGRHYEEKEAAVYYKLIRGELVLLTVKVRYGSRFPRSDQT